MRSLSPSEARVIEFLLAASPGGEVDRERESRVPRTTFQTIRRKALVEGWVQERYVPSPSAVGATGLAIRLLQPFAEHRADLIRNLRAVSNVVVLWASPETVLSVSFEGQTQSAEVSSSSPSGESFEPDWIRREWRFAGPPGSTEIPVYFDHEGAWSRRIGLRAPVSYPQSLPNPGTSARRPNASDLQTLLAFPFGATPSSRPGLRFSSAHLPRGARRLVEAGWAAHRVFPALAEIPSYNGGRDERVVFVVAKARHAGAVRRLLATLVGERRIAPFLAVEGAGNALIAMLAPAPRLPSQVPSPVLPLFEAELREIEILREPIDTLFPVVDHRYDRLIAEERG